MNQNLTDITIVLDRSGSMQSIKKDIEGGFQTFFDEQKKIAGKAQVTLVQFDDSVETVYTAQDINTIAGLRLVPRNWTALYDALGETIDNTGKRLAAMAEQDRPSKVLFVIITDGAENASKQFNRGQIFDKIKEQREKYNWQFVYIGANQDAYGVASAIGINLDTTINFCASAQGTANTTQYMTRAVSAYRMSGDDHDLQPTTAEVAHCMKK